MANTVLTTDQITREALVVLHQKLNFVSNVTRDYDDSYAVSGAKIGSSLRIRNPIQYATGTGATMATGTGADTTESKVTLTVNSQRHVPMRFTSNEMTMSIDDFSSRHIEPAMSVLAAKIENDAFSMLDDVYQNVQAGTAVSFAEIMQGRKALVDSLAPVNDRYAILDSQANVDLVDALKGLFNDQKSISKQFTEGMLGRASGFDFFENTLQGTHTTGAEGGGSAYLCNAATAQVGSATNPLSMGLIVDTGTKTIKKGDTFVIEDLIAVHPESKVSTGVQQKFTVLADATGAGTITISPAIIASGPYQNCTTGAVNNKKLVFDGAASTAYNQSLLFQRGAFAFATADLVLPKGAHMASRQVLDGISMRLVSDYDVVKDRVLTRIDVLYGYKTLRPQLACKILHT